MSLARLKLLKRFQQWSAHIDYKKSWRSYHGAFDDVHIGHLFRPLLLISHPLRTINMAQSSNPSLRKSREKSNFVGRHPY